MNYFQLLLLLFGVLFVIVMTITIVLICASYCERKFFPGLKSDTIKINNKSYSYRKTSTGITIDSSDVYINTPALNYQIGQMITGGDYYAPGHYLTGDYTCHSAFDFGDAGDFGFAGDMAGCD